MSGDLAVAAGATYAEGGLSHEEADPTNLPPPTLALDTLDTARVSLPAPSFVRGTQASEQGPQGGATTLSVHLPPRPSGLPWPLRRLGQGQLRRGLRQHRSYR